MSFYSNIIQHLDLALKGKDSVALAQAARDAVRQTVEFLFSKKGVKWDPSATLLELLQSRTVVAFVESSEERASLDFVRLLGARADHGQHVKKAQAARAEMSARHFAALAGAAFEPGSVTPPLTLPTFTEMETRRLYIDAYLEEAGWKVSEVNDLVVPGGASVEIRVTGMPPMGQDGICDYVLFGLDGKPLAVVEAKRTSENEEKGRTQVIRYGECLEKQYGVKPVLYYTNGYRIQCMDRIYAEPRQLVAFHTREELERLHALRNRGAIGDMQPNPEIAGRPYQITAIRALCEHLDGKHRKGLLVLATGTGKTRVSIALVDVLTRHNWIERVLFLADRRELVRQAHKEFVKLLPNMSYSVLSDTKLKGDAHARIMFSTHQTMIRYIDAQDKKFHPGRFDLIIIDEAHRSIFNKYGAIFRYFDSLLIGLTATPKEDVDANTYKLFDRESGEPNFAYSIQEAVKNGFLVDWDLKNRTTDILRDGITYDSLSEDEKEQADAEFLKSGYAVPPEHIANSAIFKAVYNETTCDLVLQDLMQNGYATDGHEILGKTIIFAMNHLHADLIVKRFKHLYPQYPEEFCQLIDNYEKYSDTLIDDFKTRPGFRVAVSVDMLDTGVDVPEILNLVFFKRVMSKIKFIQMVGRGTRTCKDVFGPGQDKKKFRVFDWCGNFEYFGLGAEGTDDGEVSKSLTQTLFELRVKLSAQLQTVANQQIPWRKNYRERLVDGLFKAALLLKARTARIQVRENLPHIDRYTRAAAWQALSPMQVNEITTFIAPLVESEDGNEFVKMFDARMLRIEVPLATGTDLKDVKGDVASVRKTAKALQGLGTIPEVLAKKVQLEELASDGFWTHPTLEGVEDLRLALRDLVIYIKDDKKAVVTLHLDDAVVVKPGFGWRIDIKTYREKVLDYLNAHTDSAVIRKIRKLEKLSSEDLNEIERLCFHELGTREEFDEENRDNEGRSVAGFLRSLTGLDPTAVNEKFGVFLQTGNLNALQQQFVSEIISYVQANGEITLRDLMVKTPFREVSIGDLFSTNLEAFKLLKSRIKELEPVAL